LEAKQRQNDGAAVWMTPFIEKLGDPSEWRYTGICHDAGHVGAAHCICGEPIRYEFEITDGKRVEIVGSVCIDHFQEINPALYADLVAASDGLRKAIAEAEKKAKRAEQDKRIAAVKAEFDRRMAVCDSWWKYYQEKNRTSWRQIPDWLYWPMQTIGHCPKYVQPTAYIRWYEKQVKYMDTYILPNIPGGVWGDNP
jgi:hypothetical protein